MRAKSPSLRHTLYTLLAASFLSLSAHAAEAEKTTVAGEQKIIKSHAIAMHGDIKYPADFKHFEYASPKALKGGTLRDYALGTFDSLNPFITKGTAASDIGLVYETLTTSSEDEPFTQYGLVANQIEYPEDRSWVIYHINPKARFHDGKSITADDIVFSFQTLTTKGAPIFAQYYADVAKVEAQDKKRVKFHFKNAENKELALIVGQLPVLPAHYWTDKEFDKTTLEKPLGSGPYRVASFDAGRSITYERVKDHWSKDLPVNVGLYNFDRIQVDYYRDDTVAVEALKAGQYDLRRERIARVWATGYDTPAVKRGDLVKQEIKDYSPRGMQAFAFNLRRSPFDDIKFRQALNYAFDFEWSNRNLFHDSYTRTDSFFFNSELASSGLPEGRELEILKPFKGQIPDSVFTQPYVNPKTDGSGNNRDNLRKAQQLLKEAGFTLKNGKLINPKTQKPVTIEYLAFDSSSERIINPYIQNLNRLGIEGTLRMVDVAQYINRLQSFDFDVTTTVISQSQSPGNEQREFWSSSAADIQGSRNYAGIKNPVVDQLIESLILAPNREELVARTRALDRVLLHNHYMVPQYASLTHRLVYWNKFGQPDVAPKYDLTFSTGLMTWWIDPEKERRLPRQPATKAKAE
ncbi:MAG: extracellular solute-binding protein [Cellvibrionaceae bacterium]|nr:extracellular solute-binding protein [Cellvibrionaceae bacterium]